jgi:hypothetical protein
MGYRAVTQPRYYQLLSKEDCMPTTALALAAGLTLASP